MSKIVFTGGASSPGGYLVAQLEKAGHKVFTIGKGDRCNLDFRYLGTGAIETAVAKALAFFKGPPDIIVHNARISDVANLNHVLYANINARIFLDRLFLRTHEGTDAPFRSIHILGWGPEWADTRAEIVVSNAAQQALPAALTSRVKPLAEAQREYNHRRELAKRKHDEDQARQKKIHDDAQQRNAEYHEKMEQPYKKIPFAPAEYRDKIGNVWVPNVDAVLLVPHPDNLANGHITCEGLNEELLTAVDLPHEAGSLTTLLVTK
jgi:hypothetical protein